MVRFVLAVFALFLLASIWSVLADLHVTSAAARVWAFALYCLAWGVFNLYRLETIAWRRAKPIWIRALVVTPPLVLVAILAFFGAGAMATRYPVAAFLSHLIALTLGVILLVWAALRQGPGKRKPPSWAGSSA